MIVKFNYYIQIKVLDNQLEKVKNKLHINNTKKIICTHQQNVLYLVSCRSVESQGHLEPHFHMGYSCKNPHVYI